MDNTENMENDPLLAGSKGASRATSINGQDDRPPNSTAALLKRIVSMSGPLIVSNVFGYLLSVISAMFVGQLNDARILSSVVLAGSFYNVTGLSLIIGLSSGCDTIAGQAFGAGNYKLMGETLQRAVLICWAVCLPVLVLWEYSGKLMTAMHQNPEIVDGATRYLHIAGPSLLVSAVSNNINRYLVTQRVVRPGTVCTGITALLCPLYNWVLIYKLKWGLEGAAAAFLASNTTYCVLMVGAVAWRHAATRDTPQYTWPGFTRAAFQNWRQYLSYGVPAAAMVCCEWWVFELVILMAGSLPDADLAVSVMGISFHVTTLSFMFPMSVSIAVNTLIANALGAGSAWTARKCSRLGMAVVAVMQITLATSLHLGSDSVVRTFTGEAEVVQLARQVMPLVVLCIVGDGMNSLLGGVLRGCGRQAWGAALNLVGYWLVGFPLAVYLGFTRGLATRGFWSALALASWLQAGIQFTFISTLDWKQEVRRAASLVGGQGSGERKISTAGSSGEGEEEGEDGSAQGAETAPLLPGEAAGPGLLTERSESGFSAAGVLGGSPASLHGHRRSSGARGRTNSGDGIGLTGRRSWTVADGLSGSASREGSVWSQATGVATALLNNVMQCHVGAVVGGEQQASAELAPAARGDSQVQSPPHPHHAPHHIPARSKSTSAMGSGHDAV